ncbi:MAG: 3-deoxy-D-manno-octulosonate 8-phosphate phosphatase, partial [Candidatus Paceibacterota bacterium]
MELIYDKLKDIKAFVFDVDGVMTDGSVIASEDGHFLRNFNIKDGYAIQHAVKNGYQIAIISGGKSAGVVKRFEILGVKDIYVGQEHK